eukprot:11037200-Alexandrium_andersonii.AAC.1
MPVRKRGHDRLADGPSAVVAGASTAGIAGEAPKRRRIRAKGPCGCGGQGGPAPLPGAGPTM